MENQSFLTSGIREIGLSVSEHQLTQLMFCIESLLKWNKAYNLTAIKMPKDIMIRHLLDSLSILPRLKPGSLVDVGTGPGFPGIPLAIMDTKRDYFLLDSNGKKMRFLQQLIHDLNLTQVTLLDTRAEEWQPEQKKQVIVSRAFTSLARFVELTQHMIAPGGVWQAMKGENPQEELTELPDHVKVLAIEPIHVPYLDAQRHLITLTQ